MKNALSSSVLVVAVALGAAACSDRDSATPATRTPAQASGMVGSPVAQSPIAGSLPRAVPDVLPRATRTPERVFASLPDRGDLVGFPKERVVRRAGPRTWHRADVSEAHAIRAIGGVLTLTSPSGTLLRYKYDRHVEHASGDWTWIGHAVGGGAADDAIVTFGSSAVFGTMAQSGQPPLKLAMQDGASWLVETDGDALAAQSKAWGRYDKPDFLLPPDLPVVQSLKAQAAAVRASEASVATTTTVDVVIGYTNGFEAAYTSFNNAAPALSRINFLVEVTNESYVNSQVPARVRMVHALKVNYPDNNDNKVALKALTGSDGESTPTLDKVDPALRPLHSARDQYGADLVSLVRDFQHPEAVSCGVAWLLGGGQQVIQPGHAAYGMSVVSDGSDGGFGCEDTTFAHELGHNMGLAHDIETAKGDDGALDADDYGRFPYSFGYRTGPADGNFYTVMAYNDEQVNHYRVFSNPRITSCGGFPCGVPNQADNARTLEQTAPVIAAFRSTVVQDRTAPNLYTISRQGGSGRTEVHILGGADSYQSFTAHYATALHQTGSDASWAFLIGDYDRDGVQDLYAISKMGGSGRTEVHVLDGARGFSRFSVNIATALHGTGNDNRWQFKLGDFNRDGTQDLYAINRSGASGTTEVHVLNGATYFQSFLTNIATALHPTGSGYEWAFELGDYNRDDRLDLFVISKSGGSGTTEVHVLNGATHFQNFLLHTATALHPTPADNSWEFKLGDYDRDGQLDVYALSKNGGSGTTEVHVLGGSTRYGSFISHRATALHRTGADESWEFEIGPGG